MKHECETCLQKEAVIMIGFVRNTLRAGEGSRSSAGLLCRECYEIEGERYTHMGKIGQCVIMPLSNPHALTWYNEANKNEGKG